MRRNGDKIHTKLYPDFVVKSAAEEEVALNSMLCLLFRAVGTSFAVFVQYMHAHNAVQPLSRTE